METQRTFQPKTKELTVNKMGWQTDFAYDIVMYGDDGQAMDGCLPSHGAWSLNINTSFKLDGMSIHPRKALDYRLEGYFMGQHSNK